MTEPHDVYEPRSREGGSKWWLYCLGCCCLIAVLGLGSCGAFMYKAANSFKITPAAVDAQLQAMLPCTVPQGYKGVMAMDLFGMMQMVLIGPDDMSLDPNTGQVANVRSDALTITVVGFPDWIPEGDRQDLRQNMGGGAQHQGNIQVSQTTDLTFQVRGQDTTFVERLGTRNGQKIRQVTGTVSVGAQDILLSFEGPTDAFDEDAMKAFLESIE